MTAGGNPGAGLGQLWNQLPPQWKIALSVVGFGLLQLWVMLSSWKPKDWKQFWSIVNTYWLPATIALIVLVAGLVYLSILLRKRRAEALQKKQAEINQRVAAGDTYILLPSAEPPSLRLEDIQLWARVADLLPPGEHCALEAAGNNLRIGFSVKASKDVVLAIITQIQAEWPDTQRRSPGDSIGLDKAQDPAAVEEGEVVHWIEIGPQLPDKPIEPIADDPLSSVLITLGNLPEGVRGIVQVVARNNRSQRQQIVQKSRGVRAQAIARARRPMGIKGAQVNPQAAVAKQDATREAKELTDRAESTFLDAVIRIAAISTDQGAVQSVAESLARTLCVQYGYTNPMKVLRQGQDPETLRDRTFFPGTAKPWTETELASVVHLPGRENLAQTPQLQTSGAKVLPPTAACRIPPGARLAVWEGQPRRRSAPGAPAWIKQGDFTDPTGAQVEIGMPLTDFQVHKAVTGTTGSGKSTYLRSFAAQCLGLGVSVWLQEPHGDLCEDTAKAMPDEWLHRIVYLNFTGACPPSIPVLTAGLRYGLGSAVETAMRALRVAEPASWDASQKMRDVVNHAANLLLHVEGERACVVTLNRLLDERQGLYREMVLAQCPEEAEESKEAFESRICPALDKEKGTADTRAALDSARRRMALFLRNDFFRRSLAIPTLGPAIDLRYLLGDGRLIAAPVKPAELKDRPARVIGTLLIDMIKTEFLSRGDRGDRKPTAVILDEFATMADSEIGGQVGEILAQARKFGAICVLAAQSASQLPPGVRVEFDGNTNVKVCLLVRREEDARAAIASLGTDALSPVHIKGIEKFHGYVALMINKSPQPPCYIRMIPPVTLVADREPEPPGSLRERVLGTPRPDLSAEFLRVRELAKDARNPRDPNGGREVIKYLAGMDEATWTGVVAECQALNTYEVARLLEYPQREPDKLKRILRVSAGLYGFQWFFLEAYARRLRGAGGGEARAVRGVSFDDDESTGESAGTSDGGSRHTAAPDGSGLDIEFEMEDSTVEL